ncbi:MAG: hypothetical protein EOO86_11060 [Pedobacter sp.]|nr:MAG: hypothetical protein EOO86_11060 [Pedobacter sp.]
MSNHIIHSQKMKLTVESQQDWELVQAQVGEFCSNELPVLFNSVFDQVALNDTVRIKKLDLNLGDVPLNKLTEVMKEQIYFQLLNQLNAFKLSKITKENDLNKAQLKLFKNAGRFTRKSLQNSGKISDQIETYINDYEALVYYCETGLKPWWISSSISFQPSKILLTIYKNNILLFSQFIDSVKEDVVIFNRLKQLISRSLFFEQYIAPSETDGLKTHIKLYVNPILFQKMVDFCLINFKEFKTEQATVIFENWLIDFVKKNPSEGSKIKEIQQTFDAKNSGSKKQNIHSNTLSKFLATLKSNDVELKKTPVDNFSESSPKKTTVKTLPLDSLIIENAGLVIIHPFIKSLFESFKWLNDGFFLDIYSQQRAIVYLHYLVYNQYPEDESLLLLKALTFY